jgi:hypothetical protein
MLRTTIIALALAASTLTASAQLRRYHIPEGGAPGPDVAVPCDWDAIHSYINQGMLAELIKGPVPNSIMVGPNWYDSQPWQKARIMLWLECYAQRSMAGVRMYDPQRGFVGRWDGKAVVAD